MAAYFVNPLLLATLPLADSTLVRAGEYATIILNNAASQPAAGWSTSNSIAAVSVGVAFAALLWSYRAQRESKRMQALQGNATLLANCWQQLAADAAAVTSQSTAGKYDLLTFHNLDDEKLNDAGINRKQLAYLLTLFEAATFYYEHIEKGRREEPFETDSLRYKILESPHTRQAWRQVLRHFFVADLAYTNRVDLTIDKIETINNGGQYIEPAWPLKQWRRLKNSVL